MIKKSFEKMLICILIFIMLFNFLITSICYAADAGEIGVDSPMTEAEQELAEQEEKHNGRLGSILTGLVSILFWPIKLSLVIPAMTTNMQVYAIALSAGKADTEPLSLFITPFDIIFNRFNLTDINIFSIDGLDENGLVMTIRKNIAMWFVVTTGIAGGFLLLILLVIVLKLISKDEVAAQKATFKTALMDWVVSMGLVLLMDVIVILFVTGNSLIVSAIKGTAQADITAAVNAIIDVILSPISGILLSHGALFTYCALTVITVTFLVKYLYRFFKVILLIVIAPLTPIPYSVSRMTGQKSGTSVNVWLHEMFDAVFTQIIHCIVYTCIVGVALSGFAADTEITGLSSLATCVYAVLAMFFVGPAEKLVRNIFGMKPSGGITTIIKSAADNVRATTSLLKGQQWNTENNSANDSSFVGGFFGGMFNNSAYNYGQDGNMNGLPVHTKPVDVNQLPQTTGEGSDNSDDEENAEYVDTTYDTSMNSSISQDEDGMGLAISDDRTVSKMENLENAINSLTENNDKTTNTSETVNTNKTTNINEEEVVDGAPVVSEGNNKDVNGDIETLNDLLTESFNNLRNEFQTEIQALEDKILDLVIQETEGIQKPTVEELQEIVRSVLEKLKEGMDPNAYGDNVEDIRKLVAGTAIAHAKGYDVIMGSSSSGTTNTTTNENNMPGDTDNVTTNEVVNSETNEETDIDSSTTNTTNEVTDIMQNAIISEMESSLDFRTIATDVAKKASIMNNVEYEDSDDFIANTITELSMETPEMDLSEALKRVQREGGDSLRNVAEFRENPSVEAWNRVSDIGKQLLQIENCINAKSYVSNSIEHISIETTSSTTSKPSQLYDSTNIANDVISQIRNKIDTNHP